MFKKRHPNAIRYQNWTFNFVSMNKLTDNVKLLSIIYCERIE